MRCVGDVEDMMCGNRCDDNVQDVAWFDLVVCVEFSVAFEQEADGV